MAYELPYQIHETPEQVRDGQIEVGFVHNGLEELKVWLLSSVVRSGRI